MNNMTVCNYIVGIVGAIIGAAIMNGASAFPREFTVHGPGRLLALCLGLCYAGGGCVAAALYLLQKRRFVRTSRSLGDSGQQACLSDDGADGAVLRAHKFAGLLSGFGSADSLRYAFNGS